MTKNLTLRRAQALIWLVPLFASLVTLSGFKRYAFAVSSFTECKFSALQVFDVQWNISGGNLNISGITAPYDKDFNQVQADSDDYYQFFDSTTNSGTYGLKLFNSDGSLQQAMHETGSFKAVGDDFLFYEGSGFFGTVVTTTAGFAYGSAASLAISQESQTNEQVSSFASCSSTPIEEVGPAPSTTVNTSTTTTTTIPAGPTPIPNAGFETGDFTGWVKGSQTGTLGASIVGSGTGVSVFNGSRTFTHGAHGSVGSPTLSDKSPNPYYAPAVAAGSWTFSPNSDTYAALLQPKNNEQTFNQAMAAIGISQTDIDGIRSRLTTQASASGFGSGNPTDAAWITREVQLNAGVTYTMSWNYVGTDYVPFNDGSITSLIAVNTTSSPVITVNNSEGTYALLGFTNPGTGDYSTNSYGSTGWQISTYEVSVTGTYKLGFSVFNLDDTALSPVLMIDNVVGDTDRCAQNGSNCTSFGGVVSNNPTAPTVVATTTTSTIPPETTTTVVPNTVQEPTITTQPVVITTTPAPVIPAAPETTVETIVPTPLEPIFTPTTTTVVKVPKTTTTTSSTTSTTSSTTTTIAPTTTTTIAPQTEPISELEDTIDEIADVLEGEDLSDEQQEQIAELIDEEIENGLSEDSAALFAANAVVLYSANESQAEEIFAVIENTQLTKEEAESIVDAVQDAPDSIREVFEDVVSVFSGAFDSYTMLGSNITVGQRRTVVAVSLLTSTGAVAALTGSSMPSPTGGSSRPSTHQDTTTRRNDEEELEAAGEIAGDGVEWIKKISIYKYVNGEKVMDWKAFIKKFAYGLMNMGFTLAGSLVVYLTLSGTIQKIAGITTVLAVAAAMWLHMKSPEE